MPTVVIQNESTAWTDQVAASRIAPYQKYIDLVGQDWWFKVDLHFITATENLGTPDFALKLRDLPGAQDPQGALGYHTKILVNGKWVYLGYSFVALDIQNGLNPDVTNTHELVEGVRDPDVTTVWPHAIGQGFFVEHDEELADEPCDTCEADQFSIDIDGVKCSAWAFREWFSGDTRPDGKYDSSGQTTAPWQILPGGYIGSRIVRANPWGQRTSAMNPSAMEKVWQFWTNDKGTMRPLLPREIPTGCRRWRRAARDVSAGVAPNAIATRPTAALFGGGIQQTAADADALIAKVSGLVDVEAPKVTAILDNVKAITAPLAALAKAFTPKTPAA